MVTTQTRIPYRNPISVNEQLERLQALELENELLTEALAGVIESAEVVDAWACLPVQLERAVAKARILRKGCGRDNAESTLRRTG